VDQVTDGAWPNGLTLDYVLKRIYWIDARYVDGIIACVVKNGDDEEKRHKHTHTVSSYPSPYLCL
jgi:hypothetical protein